VICDISSNNPTAAKIGNNSRREIKVNHLNRGLPAVKYLVPHGFLDSQDSERVDAKVRLVECDRKGPVQTPDVLPNRSSRNALHSSYLTIRGVFRIETAGVDAG